MWRILRTSCLTLSDIRSYYRLTREISLTEQSTYFETTQSQHVVKELKLAIKDGTLILALFCDLTTEKDGPMPTQTQRPERSLRALIHKRNEPVIHCQLNDLNRPLTC